MKHLARFLLIVVWVFSVTDAAANDVAFLEVKYLWASDLVPVVRSLLSADGKVSASERANALIVVDNPAAIQRVRDYLARFDVPPRQVGIHVRIGTDTDLARTGVGVDGSLSGGSHRPPRAGINIHANQDRMTAASDEDYAVTTTIGRPAYIRIGRDMPYRTGPSGAVSYRSADSGFEVTPLPAGDNVRLKIVPRVTDGSPERGVIRFYGAQIEITVPFGRWVDIGGRSENKNRIVDDILAWRRADSTRSVSMSLMVEKK